MEYKYTDYVEFTFPARCLGDHPHTSLYAFDLTEEQDEAGELDDMCSNLMDMLNGAEVLDDSIITQYAEAFGIKCRRIYVRDKFEFFVDDDGDANIRSLD